MTQTTFVEGSTADTVSDQPSVDESPVELQPTTELPEAVTSFTRRQCVILGLLALPFVAATGFSFYQLVTSFSMWNTVQFLAVSVATYLTWDNLSLNPTQETT